VRGTTSIYTLFSIGDLAQGKIFQYISRNICGQVFLLYYECTIDEKMKKKNMNKL
jgi:hypothetical protein